jgi:hypothetical protein
VGGGGGHAGDGGDGFPHDSVLFLS